MKRCRSARPKPREVVVIYSNEAVLVHLKDVHARFGAVPKDFTTCFRCSEPAEFLLCTTVDFSGHAVLARYAKTEYKDAGSNSVALALRAQYGSNIELPLCEFHSQGLIAD